MFNRTLSRCCLLLAGLLLATTPVLAQTRAPDAAAGITTPKQFFGFNIGDDYQQVNYTKAVEYWQKLATETNRMKLVDIGKTEMGKTEWMVIISAPENMQQLDHYREISARLALAKDLDEAAAHKLAAEGKAVVWIDGGLHSEETVGFQQLVQTIYEMVSRNDPETMRLLHDVIGLYVPVNPDGVELVSNWYNRIATPDKRTMAPGLPTVYNKYIGHDDNRDSYMSNMRETINMNRVLFQEWFPHILYNHHQTGPAGTVIFMPPFRDPFNYNFDPLVPLNIEAVGTAMHMRLVARGMGGSVQRTGANYSTWWDGGVRTTAYFHNITGLLTEIIGEPNPIQIPLIPAKQLPNGDWPLPIAPQTWHYSQSIAYELQNNRAVLDYASRNREEMLYNIYSMGRNQIKRGSEDSWTITPNRIAALEAADAKLKAAKGEKADVDENPFRPRGADPSLYASVLHDRAYRDPRGYIIPSDQPDFATATKFINVLIKNGIEIQRATSAFTVAGKHYPAGSYVVMSAQAARPFILDMFEPQNYPNDLAYPGGPPVPPYDVAGWTVALQMGVDFVRELDGFSGPFQKLPFGELQPMPTYVVTGVANPAGYVISHEVNNAFLVINRLIKAGAAVYWMQTPQSVGGKNLGMGTIYVPAGAKVLPILTAAAKDLGVAAHGVASAPAGAAMKLKPIRIGLYDEYGGSMPSGWTRWLLEQYEFPFQLVFAPELDAGKLRDKFDVLLFVDSGIGNTGSRRRPRPTPTAAELATVPAEWRARMGSMSAEKTVPALKAFVQAGGTLYTIGAGTSLAEAVGLPITSALTEIGADGKSQPLPQTKFYIPGSLLRVTLNNRDPIAYGMGDSVVVDFDHDPVFRTLPNRTLDPTVSGWFHGDQTLVSGWANGQAYLNGNAAIVSGRIGQGMVYAVGPEITFRGQPHGSFKLLFNGLYAGTATSGSPK
ncbi:MAG TPA: M14 family metallopeptidase [Rhodanobacter sp.]|nr:M14 family metallopeptidase [Rhodanobacter sp.]